MHYDIVDISSILVASEKYKVHKTQFHRNSVQLISEIPRTMCLKYYCNNWSCRLWDVFGSVQKNVLIGVNERKEKHQSKANTSSKNWFDSMIVVIQYGDILLKWIRKSKSSIIWMNWKGMKRRSTDRFAFHMNIIFHFSFVLFFFKILTEPQKCDGYVCVVCVVCDWYDDIVAVFVGTNELYLFCCITSWFRCCGVWI